MDDFAGIYVQLSIEKQPFGRVVVPVMVLDVCESSLINVARAVSIKQILEIEYHRADTVARMFFEL